jgi:DNA sulfur modification protein DndD
MTWKEGYFKEVSIDPSFRVSIVTNQGVEAYGRLAAGESVCLAFAFSLTLSKEAGLNFPMVVDTPMGRLGPDVQVNLARVIADATRGVGKNSNHQMILLMTETEYNKQVADELSTRRPKVLQINFDTKTSETTVN